MLKRTLFWIFGIAITISVAGYAAFQVSPWPSALLIRRAFNQGGIEAAQALEKHVPYGVAAILNVSYDSSDTDALLDAFYPARIEGTNETLPTILWIHGGAFLAGSKDQVANYLKILAAKGFTVIGVNYSLAPGKTYPTPVKQINMALAFIGQNTSRLHVDSWKIILAGDSAGSQIAAQLANVISVPSYANAVGIAPSIERSQLRGVILHCGAYSADGINFESSFGGVMRTMLWSYIGTKDFLKDPRLVQFSIARHITAEFPAMFISAGNADPLLPQSHMLADTASRLGVTVDGVFFPESYSPNLPHEYQFNLNDEAGRRALERTVTFINNQVK